MPTADDDKQIDAEADALIEKYGAEASFSSDVGEKFGITPASLNAFQAATSTGKVDKPGKRYFNPLGEFPTYTYNISLYMMTPVAYDGFIKSGRKKIDTSGNGGAVIVAQSGGINNATETRGQGFSLDYYIDNLKIASAISGKDNETATNTTEISFTITEPYGFSFISNLKRCADDLISKSQAEGLQDQGNPIRQFFILGIRFTGFNKNGEPISNKENALFERFYDIMLTKMTFKLDNKATVYNISAAPIAPGTAFGTKRGVWDSGGTLHGSTVYEMLTDMCKQLNEQAQEAVKGKNIKPTTYSVYFQDGKTPPDANSQSKAPPLFSASMRTQGDIDKAKLPAGKKPADTVKGDNSKPDLDYKTLEIPKGTPILQAFQLIIMRSAYIEDAFKVLQTSALEPNAKNPDQDINKTTDGSGVVRWYNVSAECTNAKYSKELADFTWDIKYVFTVYETPVIDNPYSNLGVGYYGPHKRYEYWFTGKNTEVLSYSQNLDNSFFTVALSTPDANNPSSTATPPTPTQTDKQPDAPRTDTQNQQSQSKNSFITSLFDPGAYAKANIKILGDPDFLMPESTSSVNDVYNQFYGTEGQTVNPNGGQVFIEIDFKEAQDYGYKTDDGITYSPTNDGLMALNDKIQFWNYPDAVKKAGVKGVSYLVWNVVSTFASGKFEQDLTCSINTFPGYDEKKDPNRGEAQSETGRQGTGTPAQTTGNAVPQTTGLPQDPAPVESTGNLVPKTDSTVFGSGGEPTVQTPSGPVANDDALLSVNPNSVLSDYSPTAINDTGRDEGPVFDGTNWYDENGNQLPQRG